MSWYQPLHQTIYSANALRRYNGGGATPSKVKAYCVSARALSERTVYGVTPANSTGVVTLSGAMAIGASGALVMIMISF